jgi:recombination protein RecT
MSQPQSNLPTRRPQTDVAQQEMTLQQLVKRYEANIVAALPSHVKPERVLSVIRTAITSNPGLRECSPMSVLAGIVAASRLGLELDPMLGQAYLVPRWNKNTKRMEASFQIGYQGKLELISRTENPPIVRVRTVRENDDFELVYDPEPKFRHVINTKKPRGKVVAAYTYLKFPDGRVDIFEPMSIEEAFDIRDRFAPRKRCPECLGKRGQRENCRTCNGTGESDEFTGPWVTDTNEMVKKTCLHRDSKWIPKSVEFKDAVRIENRIDAGEAPETVLLDLPAEDADNAQIAGATDARKEDLKTRLAEKTAPKPQDAPPPPPPQQSTPEPPQATAPAAAAVPDTAADEPPAGLKDNAEWPEDPQDEWVKVAGVVYRWNEQAGNYRKWEPPVLTPPAPPQPQPTRRGRPARNVDALDFSQGGK